MPEAGEEEEGRERDGTDKVMSKSLYQVVVHDSMSPTSQDAGAVGVAGGAGVIFPMSASQVFGVVTSDLGRALCQCTTTAHSEVESIASKRERACVWGGETKITKVINTRKRMSALMWAISLANFMRGWWVDGGDEGGDEF